MPESEFKGTQRITVWLLAGTTRRPVAPSIMRHLACDHFREDIFDSLQELACLRMSTELQLPQSKHRDRLKNSVFDLGYVYLAFPFARTTTQTAD